MNCLIQPIFLLIVLIILIVFSAKRWLVKNPTVEPTQQAIVQDLPVDALIISSNAPTDRNEAPVEIVFAPPTTVSDLTPLVGSGTVEPEPAVSVAPEAAPEPISQPEPEPEPIPQPEPVQVGPSILTPAYLIWAVSTNNRLWVANIITTTDIANPRWVEVPNWTVIDVSIGEYLYILNNADENIFYADIISGNEPNFKWIPGRLQQLNSSTNSIIAGVNSGMQIFSNITKTQPEWRLHPGALKFVAPDENGALVGINDGGQTFYLAHISQGGAWQQTNSPGLRTLICRNGLQIGVSSDNKVWTAIGPNNSPQWIELPVPEAPLDATVRSGFIAVSSANSIHISNPTKSEWLRIPTPVAFKKIDFVIL